jgi:hypothetical protein
MLELVPQRVIHCKKHKVDEEYGNQRNVAFDKALSFFIIHDDLPRDSLVIKIAP